MNVTSEQVKDLRHRTGCGMMDCKKALEETNGDADKAADLLRKKGLAKAAAKSGRATCEGIIDSYIHTNNKLGVILEVNCETDFVAKNEDFKSFVRDIALQITASNPKCVRREEVPSDVLEHEKDILKSQTKTDGKPPQIVEKIIDGKLDKFYQDICLLEQLFVKDPSKKIEDLIKENIAKFGENIIIKRFIRYQLGEKI